MNSFKQTLTEIKGDLLGKNKGIKNFVFSYFYSPRFRVLLNYRLGKYFVKNKNLFIRQLGRYYNARLVSKRSCDISYKSIIGKNFQMPHPIGIVIGDRVVIKDNVKIFQQVTLGSHGKKGKGFKYPVIENGVKIFAGAKIIGGVTIGENAIIGANALVNIDVPANATAVGIPCKIITSNR